MILKQINMNDDDLGSFLHENSQNSNKELADGIRAIKKLNNKHDNVVIHQEKKSINKASSKLSKIIKAFDKDAVLLIQIKNKAWLQD